MILSRIALLGSMMLPISMMPLLSSKRLNVFTLKFKVDLNQYEAELKKTSDEGKALKLFCSQKEEELKDLRSDLAKALKNEAELDKQVDQVKADYNQWKENIDRLAAEKEVTLAKLASAETQLRGAKEKHSAQAKKIDELEAKLAITVAKVAKARAEVEKTKATIDKTVVVYLRDAEANQMELREASDREKWSNDLAKCQSQRKTLEEIHARGFDLTEDIAQAKVLKADAKFLVSSDDDDDDEGSKAIPIMKLGPKRKLLPRERPALGIDMIFLSLFDLADAQSREDDSDYDNSLDESGDDTPFPNEGADDEKLRFADENENEQPD
ncbi:uncharacterized protein [Nicotiana sylvestris]|uniref:uncharacterized protein n=1 Tax=Nicotiana sylvestris TaxID=4096 RepID=UPI00388C6406